ncbi:MAG: hypothetical protein KGL02_05560, partial [Acidobacteriota bacterium]|nr:hypothetical protein [Acidobacteriota bacterium]
MNLDNTERLYLERQVTLARAVIAALSLVALLETSAAPIRRVSVALLLGYLLLGLIGVFAERVFPDWHVRIPLAVDLCVLGAFLYLTPSV